MTPFPTPPGAGPEGRPGSDRGDGGEDWHGWWLSPQAPARSWPVMRSDTPAGDLLIDAPNPWRVAASGALGAEIETTAVHPSGAVMRVRQSIDESWDVRITLGLPADAGDHHTVEGPRWRFGTDTPVQVWTAGVDGLILTDRGVCRNGDQIQDGAGDVPAGRGGRIAWRQIAGDSSLDQDAVRPLGRTVRLEPGAAVTALWRGVPVDTVARAVAMLPHWLPAELLVDPRIDQELWLDTPDAGLLMDGRPSDQGVGPAEDGRLHELQVRQARGTTRLAVGWTESARSRGGRRAEDILAAGDPRLITGAQSWILLQGTPVGAARSEQIVDLVAEALENRLARPGADFFTVVAGAALASQTGDADIWSSAMEGLDRLPTASVGTLVAHALARSRACLHDWQVPDLHGGSDAADLLVRAERAILLRPGRSRTPEPDALHALWWLGSALPAPGRQPLLARGGLTGSLRSAWAVAICSFWPQWWEVGPAWAADVPRLRQRAIRRLLLDPALTDETLALLLW